MRITKRQLRRIIREQLLLEATGPVPQTKMSDAQVLAASDDSNLKGRLVTIAMKGDWSKLKMYVDRYGPWNFLDILYDTSTTEWTGGEQRWGWADRAEEKGGGDADSLENAAKSAVEEMAQAWFKENIVQDDEANWEAFLDMAGFQRKYEVDDFMRSFIEGEYTDYYVVVPEMDLADAANMLDYVEENDRNWIDSGVVPAHIVMDALGGGVVAQKVPVWPDSYDMKNHSTTLDSFTEFLGRVGYEPEEFKPPAPKKKKRKRHLKPPTLTKQQWNAVLNSVSKAGESGRYRQSSISQDDAMAGFEKYAKKYMLQDVYDGKVFSKVYNYAESRGIGAKWGAGDYAELDQFRQEDHDYAYGQ